MSSKTEVEKTLRTASEISWGSELGRLSRDPDIAKHPDCTIQVRFHDPDELGEDETAEYVVSDAAQTRRTVVMHPDSWMRRSPKE